MTDPPGPGEGQVDADVAVVGAGPVGLVLAILLAQHGRSVVVLERWPAPYTLPRAVHFDHEVGRILQSCGIGDELRTRIEPAEIYEWRNAAGATLLRFGRIGPGLSGWPQSSMFCQPELEALLARRVDELDLVEVRRGVEVTAVAQLDDHVTIADRDGGVVRARYGVGCDGANSTVRGLAGLEVHDLGFFYDWLIVDVVLHEPRVFEPANLQVCDPARPTTVISGGPGRRRWEFMRLPGERLDELNDEARAWELLAPWDITPKGARLERHAVYTFQARYAERWRAGRVLLAGDAAHQMPPFAGQGMCAGLRDAANLAWKLALVLEGHAGDALLETYEQERLPSARQAIELSMELGKVICVPDPAEAAARDDAMAAALTEGLMEAPELPGIAPGAGLVHPEAPHAGALFIQGTVGGRAFDDVHGAGWRLVTLDPDPDPDPDPSGTSNGSPVAGSWSQKGGGADLAAWFEGIGGRIVIVAADDDPTTAAWFAGHGVSWALQRPDFRLYGTATDAAGAGALLAYLRDDLTATIPTLEGAHP